MNKLLAVICLFGAANVFAAPPQPVSDRNPVPWVEYIGATDQTVTQGTSVSTGVTINGYSGVITSFSETAAAGTTVTFTVTNSAVSSTSVVSAFVVNYAGTYSTNGIPEVNVSNIVNGAFDIKLFNVHSANALNNVVKIGFTIL